MATAEDFTPRDADIDVNKTFEDVENLAGDGELDGQITQSLSDYENRFSSQMQDWMVDDEGIFNQCDAAFRSFVNDSSVQTLKSKGANEPDDWERAKVATTQFFRHVSQMASNGYSVQTSREVPFKYEAIRDGEGDVQAEKRAEKLNLLAKWSMKRDKFNMKSLDFWTLVKKYGNIPVMVTWRRTKGTEVLESPKFDEDNPTEVIGTNFEEIETILENRPEITMLPIESVKADMTIGNIQDQECVIVSTIVGLSKMVEGIQDGDYREDLLEELSKSHQWDGYSGRENESEKKDNRALNNEPSGASSGQYLKRDIFINLPINEKGEWDEMKNVPLRYRVTTFGNTPTDSLVASVVRNQEPDDTIPIRMIHANPDDSDMLYHISNYEVIRSNLSVENTLMRQMVDSNTLALKPPLIEIRTEVDGNDRQFKPDARFICDSQDSIAQMQIRDLSQTSMPLLDYIKEDSNQANNLDKNMVGESFGARTSASEAGTISANTQRPNLVNIEYILEQYLGFVAERYKVGWEAFGIKEQVIQITDDKGELVFIRPDDISGEFDIVIDVMDDIKDDAAKASQILNYAQTVATTPMTDSTDWAGLNEELAQSIMGTTKFVLPNGAADATANAQNNVLLMLNTGQMPNLQDGMNLKKHLEVYKSERNRWNGFEDQNPNVEILDRVIAEIEQRIQQPAAATQQASPEVSQGEANRQELSGLLGGA